MTTAVSPDWWTTILLSIGAGLTVALGLIRKASRERVAQSHDNAERGMISRLQTRCEELEQEADQLREQRLIDVRQIAQLASDATYWERKYQDAKVGRRHAVNQLPEQDRRWFPNTTTADLDDGGPKKRER